MGMTDNSVHNELLINIYLAPSLCLFKIYCPISTSIPEVMVLDLIIAQPYIFCLTLFIWLVNVGQMCLSKVGLY